MLQEKVRPVIPASGGRPASVSYGNKTLTYSLQHRSALGGVTYNLPSHLKVEVPLTQRDDMEVFRVIP